MINVIEAIEKQLQAQKDEIFFKNLQVEDLEKQLAAAEEEKEFLLQQISIVESEVERLKGGK